MILDYTLLEMQSPGMQRDVAVDQIEEISV